MKSRVTISDVARAAGVSNSSVSYALNGRPGISERTRVKVMHAARELGWKPNSAARALSKARTHAIGLIVTYSADVLAVESYALELIVGLETVFEQEGYSLLMRSAKSRFHELDIMREWIADATVDALVVMNVELGDPRVAELKKHPEFPALLLCDASVADGLTTLSDDEEEAARLVVDYCHALGHRSMARVAGPEMMGHTLVRDKAFVSLTMDAGMRYRCLHTDYSPTQGRVCVERLLSLPNPPTVIVCDSDATAVTAMDVGRRRGLRVPGDLSVISWDDTFMCEISNPSVTSLNRDVVGRGRKAARTVIDMVEGRPVESVTATDGMMIVRGSTGRPERTVVHDMALENGEPVKKLVLSHE